MGINLYFIYSFLLSVINTVLVAIVGWVFKWYAPENFSTQFIPIGLTIFVFTFLIFFIFFRFIINGQLKEVLRSAQIPINEEEDAQLLTALKNILVSYSLKNAKDIEELKKLEKYRKDFLGDVSHELKTPIFNIQGYLETVLEEENADSVFIKNYLEKANQNVARLETIVKDLLLISQYETGMLTLIPTNFDIVALIEAVYESFAFQAAAKGIVLKFDKTYEKKMVTADKIRIEQVLNNLISNAIKYNNENGFVSTAIKTDGKKYTIEISDNGNGIAATHLPRLFERFYRVDKARSRKEGGTGLGLSIVKKIIEAQQEKVWVTSVVGAGTTFHFTLPIYSQKIA